MKVKELITRLLDEPMEAEVCLQDPTEHKSNGTMCNGYIFDIAYIERWSKHRIFINFKDWRTGRDCTDFVRWLMDEVMDEENWQMNAVANGEIICRKLKKLGMLDVVDGYYVKTDDMNYCPNCGADMRDDEE